MLVPVIIFLVALVGIIALLALKYWELRNQRVIFPRMREKADMRANNLKELMVAARLDLSKLPPAIVLMVRVLLHKGALAFASLARTGERQAHRLADMVSYKHRFERRETRSEFLKKVSEHKSSKIEEGSSFAEDENI